MSNYDKGRRFEWDVRDRLREDGYVVLRTAGSKSKIDLVGVKAGQLLFIQCKVNGLCPPAERTELLRLARLVGALPLVAAKPERKFAYRMLTGPGPKQWIVWAPDEVTR